MTLLEQYKNGEMKEVYAEIQKLGQNAFLPEKFPEIEAVLIETFERVAYNLEVIFTELKEIGYIFSDRPFHKPLSNTEKLLEKLDNAVIDYGYVPLSLKYFYKIVGGVDFAWDYEVAETFLWDMADPLQIHSLDEIVLYVTNKYWKEDVQYYIDDEEFGFAVLELSADDLHKDNVSGGSPYSLKITPKPSVDSDFVNEYHETTFINYLRICFDYCGFPGNPDKDSYREFVTRVRPKLKQI
jgi:hypothetical protein